VITILNDCGGMDMQYGCDGLALGRARHRDGVEALKLEEVNEVGDSKA